jgi:TPR repeat protein
MKLAKLYLHGSGVARDEVKAAAWYIIAGENGSREAKRRSIEITRGMSQSGIAEVRLAVGRMYRNGIGARVDDVAAYAWFELARAAGDPRAEAEENSLRSTMKDAEVQAARQRAASWLRAHSLARRTGDR